MLRRMTTPPHPEPADKLYSLIFGMAHIVGQIDEYEVMRGTDPIELLAHGRNAMSGRDSEGYGKTHLTCELPDGETFFVLRFDNLRYVYVTPYIPAEMQQPQHRVATTPDDATPSDMRPPTFGPPGTEGLRWSNERA
jgi:hypothetical protein